MDRPARVMAMTKNERIRAACTSALARLGLGVAPPGVRGGGIPPETVAALGYAFARCVDEHGAEGVPADLDAIAEGLVLQQAIRAAHDGGGPSAPVGDEWSTQVILGRIDCMFRERPGRFAGPDRGQRSPGDVCAAMLGVIRGGRSGKVDEWMALRGAEVAKLPQRFDGYVRTVAGERLLRRRGIDPLDDNDDHDLEIADARLAPAWGGLFEVADARESLRFVDLVIGEKQRRWLAGYLIRAARCGQQAAVDHVNACLLTNKLCAAWLIWRAPDLLRQGGDAGLLAELVRDAYDKLAGAPQTELFGVAKDVFQASWLKDLRSR